MAATIYCTTNNAFHQHSLTTARSQYSPVLRRTTLSTSFSSTTSLTHIDQQSIIKTIESDENNNEHHHDIEITTYDDIDKVLYITSDDDDDDVEDIDVNDNEHHMTDDIDAEEFLALVGLRSKAKKPKISNLTLRPLTQRLASPVCLLPIPKYSERVRQALYIRLPFLKFLTITHDIECFCSTDENAKAQSLLPRSIAQKRGLSSLYKSPKKRKLPKTEFISLATNTLRHNTSKISIYNPVHSALQCHVVLDRLGQSTIDQIMQSSSEDDNASIASVSISHKLLYETSAKTHCQLPSTTNGATVQRTMRTDKIAVKRKLTTAEIDKRKRFKSANHDRSMRTDDNIVNDLSSLAYQRIYLKCFICSKRDYVDARMTNSDVLHSHWLEHGGNLSLNIYDSEIDSKLTRVVEFFDSSKQQILEGKVKTIFILNSKEIKCSSTNNLSSNDSLIVID
ncbi:unnamed protein product [Adineta steineri]|uniref:Uncharacterized protein n=1 Tax=Adineta steineri TaxID=433720 RepID=A0A815UQ81_9BILA|nr:unnamed protein product [Adineta steineri]CAF1522984.1 unnamed protein product [Adineta steineri]